VASESVSDSQIVRLNSIHPFITLIMTGILDFFKQRLSDATDSYLYFDRSFNVIRIMRVCTS
jgi:hypothetical protein